MAVYDNAKDEARGIGLGPDHDWSSHCADSFGLMAITYSRATEPKGSVEINFQGWR